MLSGDAAVMLSVQPASNGSQSLVSNEASQCPAQRHHLRLLQQGNNDPQDLNIWILPTCCCSPIEMTYVFFLPFFSPSTGCV